MRPDRPVRPAIVLDTIGCIVEPEEEFRMLVDLRERTTRRIAELAAMLAPLPVEPAVTLPLSGLTQLAPGFLLFASRPHA